LIVSTLPGFSRIARNVHDTNKTILADRYLILEAKSSICTFQPCSFGAIYIHYLIYAADNKKVAFGYPKSTQIS
jgi:hypothetical protein